jgi:hypothetical protein
MSPFTEYVAFIIIGARKAPKYRKILWYSSRGILFNSTMNGDVESAEISYDNRRIDPAYKLPVY